MVTVTQIVINMYGQTTVSSRFAYIFWSMLILIYVYTAEYERLHNLSLANVRTKTKFNYPFFLYIFGATSIAVHHLTLFYGTAWRLPFAKILGFLGWFVMAGGLFLLCWGRASINGFWAPNIYDYGARNELVISGIYKRTRHPMYDGQFLMTLGTVMMVNNLWIVFFPVGILVANICRARREDRDLATRFPNIYPKYRDLTPFFMWVL
jgi:protein-S-isoprenylcysteine O-methyltransferase Ste14